VLSTLIAGVDYSLITVDKQKGRGGHNAEVIRLSVDGFKQFCMMAKTERGREVRLHYLEIERKFKAAQVILTTSPNHDALSQALQGQLDLIHNRISTVEAKVDTVIDGTAKITSWAQEADRKAETRHEEALAAPAAREKPRTPRGCMSF
jgi:phage anti-repressor protein